MSKQASTKSIPYKVATAAIWLIAIPAIAVVTALRGQKSPQIKK